MSKRKIGIVVGIMVAVMMLFVILPVGQEAETEKVYNTATVMQKDPLTFKGNAAPAETEKIYVDRTLGELEEIHVTSGQHVEVGDSLLTYSNSSTEAQIDQYNNVQERLIIQIEQTEAQIADAEAKKANAEKEVEAINNELKSLASSNEPSDKARVVELNTNLATAEARVESQQSQIDSLEITLDGYQTELEKSEAEEAEVSGEETITVTAPISGIVTVNDAGQQNNAVPIIEINSTETIVKATISEYDYSKIQVGQEVTLTVAGTQEEMSGTISYIGDAPKETTTSTSSSSSTTGPVIYDVFIETEQPVQNGFTVEVSMPQSDLVISQSATVSEEGVTYVFVYEDGKVEKRQIEVEEEGDTLIVKSGLQAEEVIITNPDETLEDGQSVVVD